MTTTNNDEVTSAAIGDQPEREALTLEVTGLRTEVGRLQDQIDTMTADRQALLTRMGRRAFEVGREHSWCGVAKSLVEELGGVWPAATFTFTITTTRTMTATLRDDCDRDPDDVTASYIAESLTLDLDDTDWTDVYTHHEDGPALHITDISCR